MLCLIFCLFFVKQKTAYEMRISDWSSDVCSSDLRSMQTHLVVSPVPEILDAMGADACTAARLAERLAATFDLDGTDDAQPILAERLSELAAMGLVERV